MCACVARVRNSCMYMYACMTSDGRSDGSHQAIKLRHLRSHDDADDAPAGVVSWSCKNRITHHRMAVRQAAGGESGQVRSGRCDAWRLRPCAAHSCKHSTAQTHVRATRE